MRTSAVVISHGHAAELARSLPAFAPQVDELLVIANPVPHSVPADLHGARLLENERVLSFGANANLGAARTEHELVLIANPDAVPDPDAVAILRAFVEEHPRCGVAGPKMLYPDGSWQASRRSYPTVGATLVRRTPAARVPALALAAPPLPARRAARRARARADHARLVPASAAGDA